MKSSHLTPTYCTKHTIGARWLAHSNHHVHSHFPQKNWAHNMYILFIIKTLEILMLNKRSYRSPPRMLTIDLRMVDIFWASYESHLSWTHVLLGCQLLDPNLTTYHSNKVPKLLLCWIIPVFVKWHNPLTLGVAFDNWRRGWLSWSIIPWSSTLNLSHKSPWSEGLEEMMPKILSLITLLDLDPALEGYLVQFPNYLWMFTYKVR
jgi:hypothetical protein